MNHKREVFWFFYWLFPFGVCGFHRWYLFGSKFKKCWCFFYGLLLVSFACGVLGLYDELLLVYFAIFLVQSIDGIFIKFRKDLYSEPMLTSLFDPEPAKIDPVSEQPASSTPSQEKPIEAPQVTPPESILEQPVSSNAEHKSTQEEDEDSDLILKFLEDAHKPCTIGDIYGYWRREHSRREESMEVLEVRLNSLYVDKKIRIEGQGENTLYSIQKEEKVTSTKTNYSGSLLTERQSDSSTP